MRRLARALLFSLLCAAGLAAPIAAQRLDAVVVHLARHGERAEDGTDDPPLSAAGEQRSQLLATMLRDARLTHIHTTDTRRTRATAAPSAAWTALAPIVYDGAGLDVLAARIRRTPGRHLVVGHSNTLRETVTALGGEPGPPIDQDEYDRLYVLTLTSDGTTTVLLHFGEPYRAPPG